MKNAGIFGGTFDPVHNGHIDVASLVADTLSLEQVYLVTSASPPHKEFDVLDAELRHMLVDAACYGNPKLIASRIELDMPGPSYSYRTVERIKALLEEQYGEEVAITFIVSAEYLDPSYRSNVTRWHDAEAFLDTVRLAVVPRRDYTAEMARKWAVELGLPSVHIFDNAVSDLGSGVVRDAIKNGLSLDGLVPPRVAELIRQHRVSYR